MTTGHNRVTTPTLEQVAALAGVSRSTVSRVVNGSPRVSPEAREAVELAIATLGYVPNRAARSLVTRRAGSVALVVTEPESRVFAEPFFAGIIRGVSLEVARTDLQLILLMEVGQERERMERYLFGGHTDGALLLSLHGDDPLPERLLERGLPVVMGGRPPEELGVSAVDADNVGGARDATAYLLRGGRRVVATITGPLDMAVGRDRLSGYRQALSAGGFDLDPALEVEADFTQTGGIHAMRELLARSDDIDAVFVASDLAAVGAMQALRAEGKRIPEDVAVIGFDDSIVARSSQPTLTSVRQPVERMGREMLRLLLAEIGGTSGGPQQLVLATELVVRESA